MKHFRFRSMPAADLPIRLAWSCNELEYVRLAAGHLSNSMEDKWCSFLEPPWLYINRSWTGIRIYDVRIDRAIDGAAVEEARVNADSTETQGRLGILVREPEYLVLILDWLAGRDPEAARERYQASRKQ